MLRFLVLCTACVLAGLIIPSEARAEANADRFQINRDIHIQPDDEVGDVTCINCSVYILGRVSGDVTTINGNIVAQQGATIAGDATAATGEVVEEIESRSARQHAGSVPGGIGGGLAAGDTGGGDGVRKRNDAANAGRSNRERRRHQVGDRQPWQHHVLRFVRSGHRARGHRQPWQHVVLRLDGS